MKNYKMVLAYDGTRYNGWQKQGNTENTIQEKLERILQEISGAETEVFGSGRTDAGTHATGQVMNFHINWNGTAEQLFEMMTMTATKTTRIATSVSSVFFGSSKRRRKKLFGFLLRRGCSILSSSMPFPPIVW